MADDSTLDACWKKIGVFGDKSCPKLAAHIHCRNCEVYGAAAAAMLDGCEPDLADALSTAPTPVADTGPLPALLVFRLGDDWLALPTACIEEVLPMAPVHGLPHGRSRTLAGVARLHGVLVACVTLPGLLGLEPGAAAPAADARRRVMPRLLSLATDGGAVLAPVDEVDGIHRIAPTALRVAGPAGARVLSQVAAGVLSAAGRQVTLLDGERFRTALTKSFG